MNRVQIEQLCNADFTDASNLARIEQLLGDGACMYLCEWGRARRGQPESELNDFYIDFGDRIAAIFSARFLDARSVTLGECAGGGGRLSGMFRFKAVRSRAAQTFP